MARQAQQRDPVQDALRYLRDGDARSAISVARAGLSGTPQDLDLLQTLFAAAQDLDDSIAMDDAMTRLLALPQSLRRFELAVTQAALSGDQALARRLIAEAEAEIEAHARAARTAPTVIPAPSVIPAWAIPRAKAQLAGVTGDLEAAIAILVTAIETHPDAAALRLLMTEILMAGGSAAHARAVLARLGKPPTTWPAPIPDDAPRDAG